LSPGLPPLPGLAAAAVVCYLTVTAPTVGMKGGTVSASRVLVIYDSSDSMPKKEVGVDPQLNSMRTHGIRVDNQVEVKGWSWGSNSRWSFLGGLEGSVAKHPLVDTVYIITDFDLDDNTENNQEGLSRLLRLLATHHLRLYFCSVHSPPPADYQRIARWTGGGVVHFPVP
jgi:hypothetical protein